MYKIQADTTGERWVIYHVEDGGEINSWVRALHLVQIITGGELHGSVLGSLFIISVHWILPVICKDLLPLLMGEHSLYCYIAGPFSTWPCYSYFIGPDFLCVIV